MVLEQDTFIIQLSRLKVKVRFCLEFCVIPQTVVVDMFEKYNGLSYNPLSALPHGIKRISANMGLIIDDIKKKKEKWVSVRIKPGSCFKASMLSQE